MKITKIFTDDYLVALAGEKYFERGVSIHNFSNSVEIRRIDSNTIHGVISGTYDYDAVIDLSEQEIEFDCTCPVGEEGEFCKHLVALALKARDTVLSVDSPFSGVMSQVKSEEITKWLKILNKKQLISIIEDITFRFPKIEDVLYIQMRVQKGLNNKDVEAIKQTFIDVIRIDGNNDRLPPSVFAEHLHEVMDIMEKLDTKDHADNLRQLTERLMPVLIKTTHEHMDEAGYLMDCQDRLLNLHYRACLHLEPDPEKLARFLINSAFDSDLPPFENFPELYAEVFGKKGLEILEKHFAQKKYTIKQNNKASGRSQQFVYLLDSLETSIYRAKLDWDSLINKRKERLGRPKDYMDVAELYQMAGKMEQAFEWLFKALAETKHKRDDTISAKVVEIMIINDQYESALQVLQANFLLYPDHKSYMALKKFCDSEAEWKDQQMKMLDYLEDKLYVHGNICIKKECPRIADSLVKIYISEKMITEAWDLHREQEITKYLQQELVELYLKEDPKEAIPEYVEFIWSKLETADPKNYDEAIRMLKKLKTPLKKIHKPAGLESLAKEIAEKYHRRTALIRKLKETKLLK